jgi:hypothetical protein
MYCRDKEGRLIEIVKGINSPLEPMVDIIEWIKTADEEEVIENRVSWSDFVARRPVVVDGDEVE